MDDLLDWAKREVKLACKRENLEQLLISVNVCVLYLRMFTLMEP